MFALREPVSPFTTSEDPEAYLAKHISCLVVLQLLLDTWQERWRVLPEFLFQISVGYMVSFTFGMEPS